MLEYHKPLHLSPNHTLSPFLYNTLLKDIYASSRETNPWIKKVKNILNGLGLSYIMNDISLLNLILALLNKEYMTNVANSECKNLWVTKIIVFSERLQNG